MMQNAADVGSADIADVSDTRPPTPPLAGDGAIRVRDVLGLPELAGAEVAAGRRGLDRIVNGADVVSVADTAPGCKPRQFLVTSGVLPDHDDRTAHLGGAAIARLVDCVADRGASALGISCARGLDGLPLEVLDIAERHDFPVLVIPHDVELGVVISAILTDLVGRQAWALDVSDRLHRVLTSLVVGGGDLSQLVAAVADLLQAAALICTRDGRVQSVAGSPPERAAMSTLPLFDEGGRVRPDRLRAGVGPDRDRSGPQVAVAPIAVGGVLHGSIVASASEGGLGAVALQVLERAATVAALVITEQRAISAVEAKVGADLLRDALNGAAGPPGAVIARCARLGWDVERPFAVVIVRLDDGAASGAAGIAPLERLTDAWQQALRARDAATPVVGFTREVIALLPASGGAVARLVADAVRSVTSDRDDCSSFTTGVSAVIDSIADLPVAYKQAATAVRVARSTRESGSIAHFEDLGVQRLLSLVDDTDGLGSFAAQVLRGLGGDTAEMRLLRTTLRELIDRNCNIAATARALHFHYNTLRYRIAKLEAIVGPFTTDARLRLDLALALQVVEMRGL
jgi:PucR family transcriptional regulator, purine catabolism regulatory protein